MYLLGGSNANQGNVLVKRNDEYLGPICDDSWTLIQAHVFCKQFGYRKASNIRSGSYFGKMKSEYAYDRFQCKGHENSLYECKSHQRTHCGPFDGAGVECK